MISLSSELQAFFSELSFVEKTHSYYVSETKIKYSVSKLVEQYYYPTDWEKVKKYSAKRYNTTPEALGKSWKAIADEACLVGTNTHNFGEAYVWNRALQPSSGYQESIVKFFNDLPDFLEPIVVELPMYHKKYMYAGTSDLFLWNTKTATISICDYKSNRDLFKNYKGQKMQSPFDNLLCSPFNHYQLQLSYYQILLEQFPNIKVGSRNIIWLKPDGTYELYKTEDYTNELKRELETEYLKQAS